MFKALKRDISDLGCLKASWLYFSRFKKCLFESTLQNEGEGAFKLFSSPLKVCMLENTVLHSKV